ncbi:sodium/proline symporter [Candidatus Protochlamydia naegleriophila]|uniref:Sodium/proline symporter n=1 Tax=Candidatus Protochlamydia naegleriophila TaxID=389348 RepID=A0A0U5J910_9BACT|nr:sodium/proline symporter [Candidatus Protochlamydia naegleriophila]CUI16537.1 sodium/proline symporter [Candidatus Protochlamydia naegleriophila]
MNLFFIAAFLCYFAILLIIGLLAHKKQTSSADFIMGNRSLSFWLVALSAHASDMSAWLFMGLPMSVFLLGLSQVWIAFGLVAGMFLNWQFVAPKLRAMTEKYDCYTLSSFFEKRFQDRSGTIRSLSAVMLVLFLTHYLSAGMIGIGVLLESLFGLNYYVGLLLTVCVVVAYTLVGGFVAVAWTDLVQGMFLLLVILIVPALALFKMDGFAEVANFAAMKDIPLSILPSSDPLAWLSMLLLAFSWGVGYFGMPHVVTKFMSIKSPSELNKSKWLGMSWQLVVLSAAIMVGVIAVGFFPEGLSDPQMVFVEMVKSLFSPFLAGFILCAVLAASLSTMDSQILVCASVLSEDIYCRLAHHSLTPEKKLLSSRFGVVGVSIVAFMLSMNKSVTIMETVSYSWAGLGSAFGPLVLTSLYSKKANRYGAVSGIIVGGIVVMTWPHLNPMLMAYHIPAMIPGFLSGMGSIFLVSALTNRTVGDRESMPLVHEQVS